MVSMFQKDMSKLIRDAGTLALPKISNRHGQKLFLKSSLFAPDQIFCPFICILEWRRHSQAYNYMGRSTGGFPAHMPVTFIKSLFSNSC